MIVYCISHTFGYELENLTRIFFPNERIAVKYENPAGADGENRLVTAKKSDDSGNLVFKAGLFYGEKELSAECFVKKDEEGLSERKLAIAVFGLYKELTGYSPPWGILTGVRPSKLMRKHIERDGEKEAMRFFTEELFVSEEKAALACEVALREKTLIDDSAFHDASLYVSIPFCPTRCSYCSFVSHSIASPSAKKLIPEYVNKLIEDIRLTAGRSNDKGLKIRSVYWGGGTPTTLEEADLDRVLVAIENSFDLSHCREYTVEAGRPDTVTKKKLAVLKKHGVTRISINPQTFSDSVLKAVGRCHTVADTENKYLMARELGFGNINMDLIAGLPTDDFEGFKHSVERAAELSPESITVHTLAKKRSSSIVTEGQTGVLKSDETAAMLSCASEILNKAGYRPYYMYRQSKSLGNLENVGWCKDGAECYYNVVMMEECQTILSVGAGAVTKLCNADSSYIERVFSYKYPYEYIERFDTLAGRKSRISSFFAEYK